MQYLQLCAVNGQKWSERRGCQIKIQCLQEQGLADKGTESDTQKGACGNEGAGTLCPKIELVESFLS